MILRPYQQEVATAIFDSIVNSKGLTFSVEIARQDAEDALFVSNETAGGIELAGATPQGCLNAGAGPEWSWSMTKRLEKIG